MTEWALGLLLNDDGAVTHTAARNRISDRILTIAAAQLAIDGEAEQGAIAQSPMLVEQETYCPDLLLLQRPFCTDKPAFVPWSKFAKGRVHRRVTHHSSSFRRL